MYEAIYNLKHNRKKGFTLVELLVAMTIFLIVTAVVYGMLQIGRVDRNRRL